MSKQRDGRNTDTQQRILQEAEALYLLGGYEHINQQVIADRLHITKAALFYHFASKQELFFQLLLFLLGRTHQTIMSAIEGQTSTVEKLHHLMSALLEQPTFDMNRFSQEELHLLTAEQQREVGLVVQQKLFAVVQNVFADGITQRELRLHDVSVSSMLFLQMCIPLSHPKSPLRTSMEEQERERASQKMLDLFLYGVMASSQT